MDSGGGASGDGAGSSRPSMGTAGSIGSPRSGALPGAPLLLVDTDGAVRRGMEVDEGQTVVLVYDQAGNLVFAESGEPSQERARRAWASLGRPRG